MIRTISMLAVFAVLMGATGCKKEPAAPGAKSAFALAKEPEGAYPVIKVRADAKNGEAVVVVGRIGGSEVPWGKDRMNFTIVDPSLKACNQIEGDNCETWWDYCCEPKESLKAATVLVYFTDDKGAEAKGNPKQSLGLKEGDTIVIQGQAERDKDNHFVGVKAKGFYVRSKS